MEEDQSHIVEFVNQDHKDPARRLIKVNTETMEVFDANNKMIGMANYDGKVLEIDVFEK